jgi:uncharacterized protein (TIGR03437 family)
MTALAGSQMIYAQSPSATPNAGRVPAVLANLAQTAGTIQTVAGNGNSGFSGDGGPATQAGINVPVDVYLNAAGDMFITDQFNNRIRKVTPGGTISTVAGNGVAGYAGDGGPAVDAEINTPTGIRGDSAGNLYIADVGNQRIRKVSPSGIITTIAGNGSTGYSGDGGPAVDAGFYNPVRVALLPNGNILVADQSDHRVRLINSSTGIVTTFAGNGIGTPETGAFSGDGGLATKASLNNPTAVAVTASGDVYISDQHNQRIREVNRSGIITTIAGNGSAGYGGDSGPATKAKLNYPGGINVDPAGNVYFNDDLNFRTRKITPSGIISTIAGTGVQGFSGDGGPAVDAQLNGEFGVSLDLRGNVYIADSINNRIREIYAAPPDPAVNLVLNASAYGAFTSVAPGSWIEIYGTDLAPVTTGWSAANFNGNNAPTMLDGVSAHIGGQRAFVDYISRTQVNVQLPSDIATGGPLQLTLTNGTVTSASVTVTVNATAAGLLAPASFIVGANQYVVAQHLDGTYVLPTGAITGLTSSPAQPGETIVIYGVGFGSVVPNIPAGQIVTESNQLSAALQILFGKTSAKLSYFGLAPSEVGVYQFDIVVPTVANSDLVPLTFNLGGVASTQTLFTAVRQ